MVIFRNVFQVKTSFTDFNDDSIPPALTPTKLYGPNPAKIEKKKIMVEVEEQNKRFLILT